MADKHDEREGEAAPEKPPKIKANDNPWYLLATLYGEPADEPDYDRREKLKYRNRVAWNRYFAPNLANLNDKTRARLIEEKGHEAEELTPFSPEDLDEIAKDFAKRRKTAEKIFSIPSHQADIDFTGIEFDREVEFCRYLFVRGADFNGATFCDNADFYRSTFFGRMDFCCNSVSNPANFDGVIFSRIANFCSVTFSEDATFQNTTFEFSVFFDRATFTDRAMFMGATFSNWAMFEGSIFEWESNFVNAEMKNETSFEGATFETEPPKFLGAGLHEGTVWRGIKNWPTPETAAEAGPFIDAYERLKLEMDRLKKHEDELNFFALELRSRRVMLGPWKGWPISVYGRLADYGRSYWRPLGWLAGVVVSGGLVLLLYFNPTLNQHWLASLGQSFGLSLANTLNVFGFRKDFIDVSLVEHLPWSLKVLAGLQTILGGALLFLFGLGIRNRFRMK